MPIPKITNVEWIERTLTVYFDQLVSHISIQILQPDVQTQSFTYLSLNKVNYSFLHGRNNIPLIVDSDVPFVIATIVEINNHQTFITFKKTRSTEIDLNPKDSDGTLTKKLFEHFDPSKILVPPKSNGVTQFELKNENITAKITRKVRSETPNGM